MGNLNTTNLSISKMLEKQEEDLSGSERMSENLPRESFSFDQVKMLWRRFAFQMREENRDTFYHAMVKREPVLNDDIHITMIVDNQVQIDYITPHLQDMTSFFRKELKNYSLSIQVKLTDNPDEEIKFLTGKDKFAAMARKNPNLHTLKNTFNLDIEF